MGILSALIPRFPRDRLLKDACCTERFAEAAQICTRVKVIQVAIFASMRTSDAIKESLTHLLCGLGERLPLQIHSLELGSQ
jgi:hypothetical protein